MADVDCIVVGAGYAGLSCAALLKKLGLRVIVLEARNRIGGRAFTYELPNSSGASGTGQNLKVELGCSYLHGCTDNPRAHPVWAICKNLQLPTTVAPADLKSKFSGWEAAEVAHWMVDGQRVSEKIIAYCHLLLEQILAKCQCIKFQENLDVAFEMALKEILMQQVDAGSRTQPELNETEKGVLYGLRARWLGYVRPFRLMPHHEVKDVDAEHEHEKKLAEMKEYPPEKMVNDTTDDFANRMSEAVKQPVIDTARKRVKVLGEDRIVLGNGMAEIIDRLADGLDIQLNTAVDKLEIVDGGVMVCTYDSSDLTMEFPAGSSNKPLPKPSVRGRRSTSKSSKDSNFKKDRDTNLYITPHVVVTAPLAVLKSLDDKSKIKFVPGLEKEQRSAISRLAPKEKDIPTHNKVVLRFGEADVFWDEDVPHFKGMDRRFQFLNLHKYGKVGVLLCHIWGDGEYSTYGKTDLEVVNEILKTLKRMWSWKEVAFPVQYVVTRWSEDCFALDAYSQCNTNCKWELDDIDAAFAPLIRNDKARIQFAGEHTVPKQFGGQCCHGAVRSGFNAARRVAKDVFDERKDEVKCEIPTTDQVPNFLFPPLDGSSSRPSKSKSSSSSSEGVSTVSKASGAKRGPKPRLKPDSKKKPKRKTTSSNSSGSQLPSRETSDAQMESVSKSEPTSGSGRPSLWRSAEPKGYPERQDSGSVAVEHENTSGKSVKSAKSDDSNELVIRTRRQRRQLNQPLFKHPDSVCQ